jgi:4-diphosphocytidyl-2-C-methyl-D-erythritol kinase
MRLARTSCAKVNLLLNVLGRRPDGFHELETVLLPVAVADEVQAERSGIGIWLTCNVLDLPTDSGNLVYRAARVFLDRIGVNEGVSVHLEKRLPLEAGLGGGSSNAAATLLLLNDLFDARLGPVDLAELAAGLGSDVPFFLEPGPALATGRGEQIRRLAPFTALRGTWLCLVHPGFGVSTPWAYRGLGGFPCALEGKPGRAQDLIELLQTADARRAGASFYNALEAPVFAKYPILQLLQEQLRRMNPLGVLMSGSGSTTFSLWPDEASAKVAEADMRGQLGDACWAAVVPV